MNLRTSICKHLNCSCQINLYVFCEFNVKKRFAIWTSSSLQNSQIKHKSNIHVEGGRQACKWQCFLLIDYIVVLKFVEVTSKNFNHRDSNINEWEPKMYNVDQEREKLFFSSLSCSIFAFTHLLCCYNCMEENYRVRSVQADICFKCEKTHLPFFSNCSPINHRVVGGSLLNIN